MMGARLASPARAGPRPAPPSQATAQAERDRPRPAETAPDGVPRYLAGPGAAPEAATVPDSGPGPIAEAGQDTEAIAQGIEQAAPQTAAPPLQPEEEPAGPDAEAAEAGRERPGQGRAEPGTAGTMREEDSQATTPAEAAPEHGDGGDSGDEGGAAGEGAGGSGESGGGGGDEGPAGGGGPGREAGGGVPGGGHADTGGSAGAGDSGTGGDGLAALATGDVALIDTELAEHQRWGAASARVGAAGSATRADFIARQAGAGALGAFGHGAAMGAAIGAGTQAAEIGVGRLVARLAGPALARSFPLPAIGAVVGGVFSAYDLATRDWGRTGETIGRFGEGSSIYEQLANSIAAVSEIIGIATAVLNVIAGVIGAISIAMWVITVLTVGVASPLAATLSTIAAGIGIGTMILDGINALVLQRLVTLFRALHTFTSQADPSDVEAQGSRIGEAAAASAGFVGGMAGGLAGAGATGAGARRLGLHEPPPRVPDVEPPRAAPGEGPRITADPPPAPEALPPGDRPAMPPPEPAAPRPATESPAPGPRPVDPLAPTLPGVDPLAPTLPGVDPLAPTVLPDGPGGMPEIPGPPRVPDIGPLPDYGPELPDWHPEPSPYAPTERPPASSVRPSVDSHGATVPAGPEASGNRAPLRITDTAAPPAGTPDVAPHPSADPASFADLNQTVADVANSPFGDRLASDAMAPMRDVPRDTAHSRGAVRDAAYADIRNERPAGWDSSAGLQDQHWTKVRDATVNAPAGTPPATVEAINANRSPLQTSVGEPASLLLTTEGVPASALPGGNRGTNYFIGDRPMGGIGEPGGPASPQLSLGFEPPVETAAPNYRVEHRFADRYLIPEMRRQIQDSRARAGLPPLDEVQLSVAAGEQARYVMEGTPRTDLAQRPVQPWSGRVVEPGRTPVQMLLAPEILSPDLHAQGRTVEVPSPAPRPEPPGQLPLDFSHSLPDPNQTSFNFTEPAAPRPVAEPARPAASAPTRSTRPLAPEEFAAHARTLSEQFGVPLERIRPGDYTAFHPGATPQDGYITIGPDVNPLPAGERPAGLANPANAALEPRAVLGHESLGHRDAELAGQVRAPDPRPGVAEPYWHEEFQASTRTALLDPGLTPEQRWQLMLDAEARRRHAPNGDTIYVWTESLRGPETPARAETPRPDSHFRPQDRQPSVVVDWGALTGEPGGARPRGATDTAPRLPDMSPAEIEAAVDAAAAGPMLQANAGDARLRLPAVQGHDYWGVDPASGMTVQEWNVNAARGMPRLDPAGNPLPGPRGNVRTQVRLHSPDPTAVPGSASARDWTMGIGQGDARMLPDGTWFDTRYGTTPGGDRVAVRPYRRDAAGDWIRTDTGAPVRDADTLAALAGWDRNMGASHMPLFPEPRPTPPGGAPPRPISEGGVPAAPPSGTRPATPAGGALPAATAGTRPLEAARHGPASAPTAGAPRETPRSGLLAGATRTAAGATLDLAAPGARAVYGAYFGQGSRESRIARGGTVGTVLGGIAGGPVGAYLGRQVGAGVARRAEDFHAGLQRGGEPIVEPVNPAYPPPPGSGSRQEMADLQNRLLAILQARAQAETLQGMMSRDASHHEANDAPLADFNQRTGEAISATEAHRQAVAQRDAANQQQRSQEGSVTSTLHEYGDRAAGLAVISGPLRAFTRFTYLAHALPDSPNVLRGAKRGILKMNSDGQNFLDALDGVDSAVAAQGTEQPRRQEQITANAGRIANTGTAATMAQGSLGGSQGDGQALASRNQARAADSRQREAQAAQTGAQLDGQADSTRGEIADLSAQWQAWAQAHRQARLDAQARTRAAMLARGYRIREETSQ